jgi:hypothetical protein
MTDATMSREEMIAFLAAIKKLRDQLDVMQVYVARAVTVVSKTEETLKDVRTIITDVATRIAPRND